ncbi:MAG: hypothetical protein J5757_07695 [Lachnospiraceae bacterium]|nr:hypothetical protein [Lachnospiraceae bacterium]
MKNYKEVTEYVLQQSDIRRKRIKRRRRAIVSIGSFSGLTVFAVIAMLIWGGSKSAQDPDTVAQNATTAFAVQTTEVAVADQTFLTLRNGKEVSYELDDKLNASADSDVLQIVIKATHIDQTWNYNGKTIKEYYDTWRLNGTRPLDLKMETVTASYREELGNRIANDLRVAGIQYTYEKDIRLKKQSRIVVTLRKDAFEQLAFSNFGDMALVTFYCADEV